MSGKRQFRYCKFSIFLHKLIHTFEFFLISVQQLLSRWLKKFDHLMCRIFANWLKYHWIEVNGISGHRFRSSPICMASEKPASILWVIRHFERIHPFIGIHMWHTVTFMLSSFLPSIRSTISHWMVIPKELYPALVWLELLSRYIQILIKSLKK